MRVGYSMTAECPCGEGVQTYAEAESPGLGAQRCLEEFPPEDGWFGHKIKDGETGQVYLCKRKEPDLSNMFPFFGRTEDDKINNGIS